MLNFWKYYDIRPYKGHEHIAVRDEKVIKNIIIVPYPNYLPFKNHV